MNGWLFYQNTKTLVLLQDAAPALTIENEMVLGETGINILGKMGDSVSLGMLDLALNAFQQEINSADNVCKSPNSYCTERAIYNIETGILNLPSIEYTPFLGGKIYTKTKMQKVGDDLTTFLIAEIE